MSVDAKMFVTCGKDKLFDVLDSVVSNLNIFVREKLDFYWMNNTDAAGRIDFLWNEDYKAQSEIFTNGVSASFYDPEVISLHFGIGDENLRSLKVFPNCSCDNNDVYNRDKIKFSIGCWGSSDEIMKVVGKSLAQFGDVYYNANDCDDTGFELLYKKGGE